jgi:hypothetical protein
MKAATLFPILVATLLLATACGDAPDVMQGQVLAVDHAAATLTLEDERTGKPVDFDFRGAEVGSRPEVGDLIRLAYRARDGKNVATRLMNLSRQAEVGKKKK